MIRGVITSKNLKSENNELRFWISDRAYSKAAQRRAKAEMTTAGGLVEDFGFYETDRILSVGNVKLSLAQYETLEAMQEDNVNPYEFSDGINVWEVVIRSIEKESRGNHYLTTIVMLPVEKVV